MKNTSTRKAINLTLSLLMMLAMTAFLFMQIAKTEAYAAKNGPEETQNYENVSTDFIKHKTVSDNQLDDSDVLLEDFLMRSAKEELADDLPVQPKKRMLLKSSRISSLTEGEQEMYNYLKTEIEKISCGERADSYFEMLEVGTYLSKTTYTAEELGVEALWVETESGKKMTDEASDALYEAIAEDGVDYSKVVTALLCDLPYDLYWFDKTVGYGAFMQGLRTSGEAIDISELCLDIFLCVDKNYSASYEIDTVELDTEKTQLASTAASTAANIVSNYSTTEGEDYKDTDYGKLLAYKNWICQEVTYDRTAPSDGYGDPWQVIYVFDSDTETNVVCEGYSKAFKFLCDLTSNANGTNLFSDKNLSCNLVSGLMTGGTGAGEHMWNNVFIDGKTYLVDVTNCDEGTIGYEIDKDENQRGKLFLRGLSLTDQAYIFEDLRGLKYEYDEDTYSVYTDEELTLNTVDYVPHVHTWDSGVVIEEPTCEKTGTIKYSCTTCSAEKTGIIETTEHIEQTISAEAANCTETGLTEGKKCSVCGKILVEQQTVAPLGHDYQDVPGTAEEATCKKAGRTADKKCSRCEVLIAGTEIPIKEHSWNQIETVAPTIDADGSITYRCSGCGDEKTEEIPKPIPIDVPKAKTLTYNGKTQTGVATGTGYTLSGTSKATKAGSYTVKATPKSGYCWKDGSTDAKTIKWTINKAANPLTVKAKTKTIKYKTLKKKKQTLGIKNVVTFTKNGQGTVTYVKASGNKGITINKKTGAVTVKKGLKKGTYRVKVKISAAGNANYKKSAAKTVTFTVKVK